jgi:hypothetical protein
MGRRALSKEHKQAKQRERFLKYLSNPEKLARKREADRLRKRERYRQAQLAVLNPLALLADMATRARSLKEQADGSDQKDKRDESLASFEEVKASAPFEEAKAPAHESTETGTGGFEDKSVAAA